MLESVVGRTYGPAAFEIAAAKVEEFVLATTDDPDRWSDHAPPAYAGALLFAIAPRFLDDPDVAPHARMVIHGEQSFTWHGPLTVGTPVRIHGKLERVRERSGIAFATFTLTVTDGSGTALVDSRSTFLMSGDAPPGGNAAERPEPAPDERAECRRPGLLEQVPPEGDVPVLLKSASRSDLVRYAAASRDFNPIHWDHGTAVDAGLGGVVAHGLLAAAWAIQSAAQLVAGPHPLRSVRVRFRQPLYPATPVGVKGSVAAHKVDLDVASPDGTHVVAAAELTAPTRDRG